jgi:hypothetical protein
MVKVDWATRYISGHAMEIQLKSGHVDSAIADHRSAIAYRCRLG